MAEYRHTETGEVKKQAKLRPKVNGGATTATSHCLAHGSKQHLLAST
jgi:hypothetical protein